ncbi:adhesive plaque matrix protein-like [Bacillus rossius redtenbacheri]|uniref:adhesive plaque matrix protein-like n=1 Tax=Bacillus rossius redtenbacheri TaxID=93214 RepID=UPI002FDDCA56
MRSLILILGAVLAAAAQRRPPNYSQEYMPDTSFDCRDKILGGYYADLETDCQMFHVCVKVPGVGVQDFRFLCPNDTSFDQENQICASWYEVNCDANILFYSDNFDLYRIGYSPSGAAQPSSSAAPIALGPSTARPAPRSRPQARPQARPREDEEEFYLQRSDSGDRRLQQGKDLRSSSSNYFGRNKGKEEDYSADAYLKKTAKPYKPVAPTTAAAPTTLADAYSTAAKKKVAVRKLRKRPQQQQQPEDPTTAAYDQSAYRGQQGYNAPRNYDYVAPATSTTSQAPADVYSTYTPRYNTVQRNGSPPSTTQVSAAFGYDGSYQQAGAQNNYNGNNYNFAPRASSARATDYPTTPAPTNNYQNIQRKTPEYPTTTLRTAAPSNYYQGNANAAASYQSTPNYESTEYSNGKNYNYNFNGAYTSTAAPASYDQYNNYQSAARGTKQASPSFPATTVAPAYSSFQTTSEAYKYNNYNYQKTAQPQYDAQPGYQPEAESLRTAQSSNYGPSSFNNYQGASDGKANASSATPKKSPVATGSYDYSAQQSTTPQARASPAAYSPTAPAARRRPPTTAAPVSSTKGAKDVSYDYAYYDESNTEYDGLDPISDHHFGKGKESFKVARSAKP